MRLARLPFRHFRSGEKSASRNPQYIASKSPLNGRFLGAVLHNSQRGCVGRVQRMCNGSVWADRLSSAARRFIRNQLYSYVRV
jgi:hypothetical protein